MDYHYLDCKHPETTEIVEGIFYCKECDYYLRTCSTCNDLVPLKVYCRKCRQSSATPFTPEQLKECSKVRKAGDDGLLEVHQNGNWRPAKMTGTNSPNERSDHVCIVGDRVVIEDLPSVADSPKDPGYRPSSFHPYRIIETEEE